ncbi:MAG: ribosome-associated translation inhibitor RaiA [Calditrichaeota bacterium]|nr:ribosome-associated translation inhibitor RaiA [Calditrichota bacterium]
MKVTISARHFEASDKLQTFAVREVERLRKFFDGQATAEAILEENGSQKSVELRLTMLGKLLPARVEGADFYAIIPQAVEKIARQVKATKEKVYYPR